MEEQGLCCIAPMGSSWSPGLVSTLLLAIYNNNYNCQHQHLGASPQTPVALLRRDSQNIHRGINLVETISQHWIRAMKFHLNGSYTTQAMSWCLCSCMATRTVAKAILKRSVHLRFNIVIQSLVSVSSSKITTRNHFNQYSILFNLQQTEQ
jgi:hypothetical protein